MITTQAIVIRLTRLTDSSIIAHVFTDSEGLVKLVARGAKRPLSPFFGKLDLFFGAEVSFVRSRRGELHPLREIVIHEWREGLRTNYVSTLLGAYFCQLLELAVETEHPEPEIYDLLRRALDHLHSAPAGLKALRHYESELARLLGITDTRSTADGSLRNSLGTLPATRGELIERLSAPQDFDSSADRNGR